MRILALAAVSLFASSLVACAAPAGSEGEGDEANESQDAISSPASTCSKAAYDAGFKRYKAAVDRSKLRASGHACDEVGATLGEIAGELLAATKSCGDFRNVVATSKWAQPVRTALKGNLALAAADGRLELRNAAGKATFRGLAEALPGVTLFGPAPGAYGNMSKITFAANGAATLSRLEFPQDNADGMPAWKDGPAKWSVGAVHGNSIDLSVTVGTKTTVYVLTVPADGDLDMVFSPKSGGDEFRAMPSECEA